MCVVWGRFIFPIKLSGSLLWPWVGYSRSQAFFFFFFEALQYIHKIYTTPTIFVKTMIVTVIKNTTPCPVKSCPPQAPFSRISHLLPVIIWVTVMPLLARDCKCHNAFALLKCVSYSVPGSHLDILFSRDISNFKTHCVSCSPGWRHNSTQVFHLKSSRRS